MKTFPIRLLEWQDLKKELIKLTQKNNIQAGIILTGLWSLKKISIRLADWKTTKIMEGFFEICSLVWTLSQDWIHIHISISDERWNMLWGHLLNENIIYTTAEIVVAELEDTIFSRAFEEKTGFKELFITKK